MKRCGAIGLLGVQFLSAAAWAQPADQPIAPATTTRYPPGVSVAKTENGFVYVDSKGRTLYGMDMRTVIRLSPDPAKYCQNACAEVWEPMLAPSGSTLNIAYPIRGRRQGQRQEDASANGSPPAATGKSGAAETSDSRFIRPQQAPDWTIIDGPQGPQWVYKGWHLAYIRKGDTLASTRYDGSDNFTWNTLKFIPPVPTLVAPPNVSTAFVDGAYALTSSGKLLFTGHCGESCSQWVPLVGGMASHGIGEWTISRDRDSPQWLYRGKPVFVSQEQGTTGVARGGVLLRP